MVTATMPGMRGGRLVRSEEKGRVRADALPEFTRYRDDGCDVHPSCLSCPLPRCRYEEPGGLRALLNEARDREIVELRSRGVSVAELASRFAVSRRTIFRVLGNQARQPIPIRPREEHAANVDARREAHCA